MSFHHVKNSKSIISFLVIIAYIAGCHKDDSALTGWNNLSYDETISQLNSVFFTNENTGYITGYNETTPDYAAIGYILKTSDGGNTWSAIKTNSESINWLSSVYFSGLNTGYVAGYKPETGALLLKTIDGGINWNQITLDTAGSLRLSAAYFKDSYTGYLTGYKNRSFGGEWIGTIIKTVDGGNSWSESDISNPRDMVLNSISFPEANTGYLAGEILGGYISNGVLLKTTDGGATWSDNPVSLRCAFKSIYFTDKNTGFGVGEKIIGTGESTLVKTTNGGITWSEVTLPTNSQITLNSIAFADASTGYAVGSQIYRVSGGIKFCAAILKTTDGGASWNLTLLKNAGPLNSVHIFNLRTVYAVGNNGTILKEAANP